MRGQAKDPSGEALSPEKGQAWPGFPGMLPDLEFWCSNLYSGSKGCSLSWGVGLGRSLGAAFS